MATVLSGSGTAGSSASANTGVNKAIQALAHRYCVECKGTFDELSKITQVHILLYITLTLTPNPSIELNPPSLNKGQGQC